MKSMKILSRIFSDVRVEWPWMTLRDWFAGQAAAAEVASAGANLDAARALAKAAEVHGRDIPDQIAFNAYEVADALLRARSAR